MSIRRNYRSKAYDSDEDINEIKCKGSVTSKVRIENTSVLSFGDEFDDTDTFKERKAVTTKKDPKKDKRKLKKAEISKPLSPVINVPQILNKSTIEIPSYNSESDEEPEETKLSSLIPKGDIPDAEAIDMLKKKREMAAKQQSRIKEFSPEEIRTMSLSFDRDVASPPLKDNCQTVTKKRMVMVGQRDNFEKERQVMRDNFLAIEHGSDRDSDQENEWENRQMQNAIDKTVHGAKTDEPINWQQNTSPLEEQPESMVLNELYTIGLDELSIGSFTDLLHRRKEEILRQRQTSESNIYSKKQILLEKLKKAQAAASDIPILELKYNIFNNFKQYIGILVECFNDKMEKIVYLERRLLKLHRERTDKLARRRRQDVQDQFDEARLSASGAGGAVQSTFEQTNRAARSSDRESRRLRRARLRETRLGSPATALLGIAGPSTPGGLWEEGLSSDDEETKSALSSRENEIEHIRREAESLFSDVNEEFNSITVILDNFVAVHQKFVVEYTDAYISGFIPHIISPFIRLEIIIWNPLTSARFDKWPWFKLLVDFCKTFISDDSLAITESSVEFGYLKLIPVIFEKTIIPKITDWIPAWDPMSASETQNLTRFLGKLLNQMPTINDKSSSVRNLLKAIACRINECIVEDISIPLYIDQFKQSPNGPAFQFFNRQLWAVTKTFCNIMMFHEVLEKKLLCKLAMEGVLNNYIITGLSILTEMDQPINAMTVLKMARQSFPRSWFSSKESDINDFLAPLIGYVNRFGVIFRRDKVALEFAYSTLDYFNISRSELHSSLKEKGG